MLNNESSPTVTNCTFTENSAYGTNTGYGGGMSNELFSSPTVTNCIFTGNSVGGGGGGMENFYYCSPTVTNCTFTDNSAEYGGGMSNLGSDPIVNNCTITGNSATNGNALACDSYEQSYPSNLQVTNSVLWDGGDEIFNNDGSTISITYSDIQGGWMGVGNIDDDPLFVDPNNDDYHIMTGSPCIDVGDNSVVDANIPDLDGNPRIMNDVVDMGAYEFLGPLEADVHIIPSVINRNNRLKRIIAIVRLPEGINKADVSDEPFVLHVAGDEIDGIEATWQRVIGWGSGTRAFAFFSKDELMDLVSGNGPVELTVTGKLESGRGIYGSDTVRIVRPRRRRARWRRR